MPLSFKVMRADDPFRDRYARGTRSMTASEIRALFAVASRPEVVSLAGGMPFTALYNTKGELAYFREGKVVMVTLRDELNKLVTPATTAQP